MSNDQQIVTDFFAAWTVDRAGMLQSFDDFLSADCIWKNSGFPDAIGRDAMVHLMQGFCEQLAVETIGVDISRFVCNGGDVVTERIDHLRDAEGHIALSMEVLGIMRVADGKIISWHDYADPREALDLAQRKAGA